MKMRLVLILLIIFFSNNSDGQWDKSYVKKTMYFSSYIYSVRLIVNNGKINKEDTLFKVKNIFELKLDTIINLNGVNRKIIAFSKCIDSPLLNTKRIFVKGKLEELPSNKDGTLDYSLYNKIPERDKSTILYQRDKEVYTLTVPCNFFTTFLQKKYLIDKLDLAILNINRDSSGLSHQLLESYVYFQGMSFPIIPLVELNKNINTPDMDFENQFYVYDNTIKSKSNRIFGSVDWYVYNTKTSNHTIGISDKFGIVEVNHEWEEKRNILKRVILKLIKIE